LYQPSYQEQEKISKPGVMGTPTPADPQPGSQQTLVKIAPLPAIRPQNPTEESYPRNNSFASLLEENQKMFGL
jgi:hypothetical protein